MNITRYPEQFGSYRYRLTVEFTDQDAQDNRGNLVVVMSNPATTQEGSDLSDGSHTRRRLIKFARREGYKAITEANLFVYRARNKPELLKVMRNAGISLVGPENDQAIPQAVGRADRVVVAWGNVDGYPLFSERAKQVAGLLMRQGRQLYCLGKNKDGSPTHPARISYVVQTWP